MSHWKIVSAKVSEDGTSMEVSFKDPNSCNSCITTLPADEWNKIALEAERLEDLRKAHDHGYISGGNSAIDGHLFDSDVSARKESLAEFFKVKGKGNREMKEGVRVYRIKHIDGSIHYSDVPFAIHGADRFCKGLFFEDCDLEAFARKVWNAGRQYPQPAGMSFEEWWAREKAE